MAKIQVVLDSATKDKFGRFSVRLMVRHNKSMSSVSPRIFCFPDKFNPLDQLSPIIGTDVKTKLDNQKISTLYIKYASVIQELELSGRINLMKAKDIISYADHQDEFSSESTFFSYVEEVFLPRYKSPCTIEVYKHTLGRLRKYYQKEDLRFEDMTLSFLERFDEWLRGEGNSVNTRSIHFRNIRTIFNSAIDEDVCGQNIYPFRKFKVRSVAKEKKFLRKEDMRKLMGLEFTEKEHTLAMARDVFMLSFYLCGANPVDIFNMKKPDKNNIITFVRQKTAHKETAEIHITIPPEALPIIERYKDEGDHLINIHRHYVDYDSFYHTVRKRVSTIGVMLGVEGLTFYFARYSWATFADSIGVDEKVIGKSLGHSDVSLAGQRYISYNWERTDKANRMVIDYLFR